MNRITCLMTIFVAIFSISCKGNLYNNGLDSSDYLSLINNALNNSPVAYDISITTPEDTAVNIELSASDSVLDVLSYYLVDEPEHGVLDVNETSPNWLYTPELNYHGTDSFTFYVKNNLEESNTATISIVVEPVNDKPVAEGITVSTDENTAIDIALKASDHDGDELIWYLDSQPVNGTLSGSAPYLTYTPDTDYSGSDSFAFHVNDSIEDSNIAAITIKVKRTWYVNINAAGNEDGASWENACIHPKDAMNKAAADEQIWVAAGIYRPKSPTDTYLLEMNDDVAVYGGFNATETDLTERDWDVNETILNGDYDDDGTGDVYHVVIGADNAVLDGFTVTKGNANGDVIDNKTGGGIYNVGESPLITNCIITNNSADSYGGGIYCNSGGSPTITDCFINNNTAFYGGGIGCWSTASSPIITDCIISENEATYGGGLCSTQSSMSITNSMILDNTSADAGGGIGSTNESTATFINCIINGNTAASQGGGFHFYVSSADTLVNCIITDNKGAIGAGVCYQDYARTNIINCTIVGNEATNYGGGLWPYGYGSWPTVTNCIIWANIGGEVSGSLGALYNCDVKGGYTGDGDNNIDANPLFMNISSPDSSEWDLSIPFNSPCIDAGDNTAVPVEVSTDFDGNPRIVDGDSNETATVDMGAFEYQ